MPVTIESVARQLIASIDSDAGYLLASQWIIKRYGELAIKAKLRHLRQVGQVNTPESITTGTVTCTRGSNLVIGDATATAAWSNTLIGWHIRLRTNWYEIVGYSLSGGFGVLELLAAYEEDDVAAGSYRAIQRWVPLAPDVSYIGNCFINSRRRMPISLCDYQELDTAAPSRSAVSGTATHVAEAPQLPDGRKRVEFYPYSATTEAYWYVYWKSINQLTYADYVPPSVPAYILIEGALIDLFRYKMAKSINANNSEAAAFWRNEMRTQETKWKDHLVDAIGADRGEDDASFIIQRLGAQLGPTDITTASQHILAGWNWPSS